MHVCVTKIHANTQTSEKFQPDRDNSLAGNRFGQNEKKNAEKFSTTIATKGITRANQTRGRERTMNAMKLSKRT